MFNKRTLGSFLLASTVLCNVSAFAAQQAVNVGIVANDHTGDPLHTAFGKINSNFNELYNCNQLVASSTITKSGCQLSLAAGAVLGNLGFTPARPGINSDITGLTGIAGQVTATYGLSGAAASDIFTTKVTVTDPTTEIRPTTFNTTLKINGDNVWSTFGVTGNLFVDPKLYQSTGTAKHLAGILGIASLYSSVPWFQGCVVGVSCPGYVEALNGGEFLATMGTGGEVGNARDVLLHAPSFSFPTLPGALINNWFGVYSDGCFSGGNAAMCYYLADQTVNYSGFGTLTPIAALEAYGYNYTSTATGTIKNGIVCISTSAVQSGKPGITPWATVTSAHITGVVHIGSAARSDVPNGQFCYNTDDATAQTYTTPETLTFNNVFRGFLTQNASQTGRAGYYYTIGTASQAISGGTEMGYDTTLPLGSYWALNLVNAVGTPVDIVYARTTGPMSYNGGTLPRVIGMDVGYTSVGSVPTVNNAFNLAVGPAGIISDGGFSGGGAAPTIVPGSCGGTVVFADGASNSVGSFTLPAACVNSGGVTFGLAFNRNALGWVCKIANLTNPAAVLDQSDYTNLTAKFKGNTNAGDRFTYECMSFGYPTF
jgi:hypothetical protein